MEKNIKNEQNYRDSLERIMDRLFLSGKKLQGINDRSDYNNLSNDEIKNVIINSSTNNGKMKKYDMKELIFELSVKHQDMTRKWYFSDTNLMYVREDVEHLLNKVNTLEAKLAEYQTPSQKESDRLDAMDFTYCSFDGQYFFINDSHDPDAELESMIDANIDLDIIADGKGNVTLKELKLIFKEFIVRDLEPESGCWLSLDAHDANILINLVSGDLDFNDFIGNPEYNHLGN